MEARWKSEELRYPPETPNRTEYVRLKAAFSMKNCMWSGPRAKTAITMNPILMIDRSWFRNLFSMMYQLKSVLPAKSETLNTKKSTCGAWRLVQPIPIAKVIAGMMFIAIMKFRNKWKQYG